MIRIILNILQKLFQKRKEEILEDIQLEWESWLLYSPVFHLIISGLYLTEKASIHFIPPISTPYHFGIWKIVEFPP